MGIRGELYSAKFASEGRTYFFNVKQNRVGDVFLSIVESKPSEGESFDRRAIVVFGDQMGGFLDAFRDALKFMDKTGNKVAPTNVYDDDDETEHYTPRSEVGGYSRAERRKSSSDYERSPRSRREEADSRAGFDGPRDKAGFAPRPHTSTSPFRSNDDRPRGFAARQGNFAAVSRGFAQRKGSFAPREGSFKSRSASSESQRSGGPRSFVPREDSQRSGGPRSFVPREDSQRSGGPRRDSPAASTRGPRPGAKHIVVKRKKSQE